MRIIEWRRTDKREEWIVYSGNRDAWQEKGSYQLINQQMLYSWLVVQDSPFQLAFIDLNVSFRNTLYALMPEAKVIIKPIALISYLKHFTRLAPVYCEEVAVCIDDELTQEIEEASHFVTGLYKCTTKEEAKRLYDEWQLSRSRINPIADKLQNVIEIFEEEIFNYFVYKSILMNIYTSKGK